MNQRERFSAGIVLAAMALSGCVTGGDGGKLPQPPTGEPVSITPYVVQGDRLLIPVYADTTYGCHGDTLVSLIDTVPADTVPFQIRGDTLTLITSVDTPPEGAVVENLLLLVRSGGQNGLEGTWRYGDQDFRVASGTLTAWQKDELDERIAGLRYSYTFNEYAYVFESGAIRAYKDEKTAERAMARWYGTDLNLKAEADSLIYDMDARMVDKYTVEYRGRRTSETIRVTKMPNGDLDFVSLDPAHAAAHIPKKPAACPGAPIPAWYFDFQAENRKPSVP
jgi:hypothetical protein